MYRDEIVWNSLLMGYEFVRKCCRFLAAATSLANCCLWILCDGMQSSVSPSNYKPVINYRGIRV